MFGFFFLVSGFSNNVCILFKDCLFFISVICIECFFLFGDRLCEFYCGYCVMVICCGCEGFGRCMLKCVVYVCGCVGFGW